MVDNCSICNSSDRVQGHHLSYGPEITIKVCFDCHRTMHKLAKKTSEQQEVIIKLVKQYGKEWVNGYEQYRKSFNYRLVRRKYLKTYMRNLRAKEKGKQILTGFQRDILS